MTTFDPDANLAAQLSVIDSAGDGSTPTPGAFFNLAALVVGMDHWLRGGGALPQAWRSQVREPETCPFFVPGVPTPAGDCHRVRHYLCGDRHYLCRECKRKSLDDCPYA